MGLKKLITAVLLFVLCAVFMPVFADASFIGDTGALVLDSEYFKDRGFDNASAMLESAKDRPDESFVLIFYSRYDSTCQKLIPEIQKWADSEKFTVYGIDQYNKYIREYGYFNTKTAFEGWEEYVDRETFLFPAVFAYNADVRQLFASDDINSMSAFKNHLSSSGMLNEAYHDYSAAGASSQALNKLGLFLGTDVGFELLRKPNRVEALVMLLRLLGKEEEALMLSLPHPFMDVPAWASPYVGYAYKYNITEGFTSYTFGSEYDVTSAQFLTFVLRALGYSSNEGGDFTWQDPFDLAKQVGILPDGVNTKEFLRADMTVVCRSAIRCNLKNSTGTLADRLVYQRAVTSETMLSAMGISVAEPSARNELKQTEWKHIVDLTPHSPAYLLAAIDAAVYARPDYISFTVDEGTEMSWAVFLANDLRLPDEAASSFEVFTMNNSVFIKPEYTVAAGALACLTLEGYKASPNEGITARFVLQNIEDIKGLGGDAWSSIYFAAAEIISDEEIEYNDADAALLLKRCTAHAIEKGFWLVREAEALLK